MSDDNENDPLLKPGHILVNDPERPPVIRKGDFVVLPGSERKVRIGTDFDATGATTGRFKASEENLANMGRMLERTDLEMNAQRMRVLITNPETYELAVETGMKLLVEWGSEARKTEPNPKQMSHITEHATRLLYEAALPAESFRGLMDEYIEQWGTKEDREWLRLARSTELPSEWRDCICSPQRRPCTTLFYRSNPKDECVHCARDTFALYADCFKHQLKIMLGIAKIAFGAEGVFCDIHDGVEPEVRALPPKAKP